MLKRCSNCKLPKETTEFTNQTRSPDGLNYCCRSCKREIGAKYRATHVAQIKSKRRYHYDNWRKRHPDSYRRNNTQGRRKRKYGLTADVYQKLLEKQAFVCAICKRPETKKLNGVPIALAVDHNHETGKIRGLLCNNCNRAIGLLRDDPDVLFAARMYLLSHKQSG